MGLKITVKGQRSPDPTDLPPPGERRGTVIVDPGGSTPPGLPVYVTRSAMAEMRARAKAGGDFEVGGFLMGGYHRHDGYAYVDITDQVPSLKAESARAHLTFSNEAQREFNETVEQRYPGKLVVGWYHTHPGYGVFLSGYDLFIQRSFYGSPEHVAVVIDPKASAEGEVGVFVWEKGDISSDYGLIVYDQEA
jgi:proteasome lid subunit RPN8/RPN11